MTTLINFVIKCIIFLFTTTIFTVLLKSCWEILGLDVWTHLGEMPWGVAFAFSTIFGIFLSHKP